MKEGIIIILLFFSICFVFFIFSNTIFAQQGDQSQGSSGIMLSNPKLKLDLVTSGLDFPTTMAFLGPDDFLILEKSGTVKRVTDGQIVAKPLLHVDVNEKDERGLLGIAVSNTKGIDGISSGTLNTTTRDTDTIHNVFLYYITCEGKNADCKNQIYKYDLDNKNNALINPKLLLSIPSFPDSAHIGGIIDIGPDNNLYFTIGNFQHTIPEEPYKTKTQNFEDGKEVDGRAGILRITQDGKPVGNGILGNEYPLNLYYAYGIKNSFGLDFDPVTGKLWFTENGPRYGDEINLAEPGSNSGSDKIFGIWRVNEEGKKLEAGSSSNSEEGGDEEESEEVDDAETGETKKFVTVSNNTAPKDMVYFEGRGHYSAPEFTWDKSSPPTGLLFLNSDKLGSEYKNDMFVGSVDGRIFHFDLNANRTELLLKGVLEDKIATDSTEYGDILFGEGFSIITDLKQGPDGYLYVVSGLKGSEAENPGAVYRIVQK